MLRYTPKPQPAPAHYAPSSSNAAKLGAVAVPALVGIAIVAVLIYALGRRR